MTLVIDASVAAELLLNTPSGQVAMPMLQDAVLLAPAHFPLEVASVIRGWELGTKITTFQSQQAFEHLKAFQVELYPVIPLLVESWKSRQSLTVYDGVYVALARLVVCSLVTFDRRLAHEAPDVAFVSENAPR